MVTRPNAAFPAPLPPGLTPHSVGSMRATSLTLVFTNAAGELLTHPAGYAVLRYRAGTWGVAELARLLTSTGALLLGNRWQRLLADARLLPPLSPEAKAWITANWMGPTRLRPEQLHTVVLQPAEVFARLAASQMQALAPHATRYHHCPDEAAAHACLLGLPR
ncbi:hypothetical protein Q5H92_20695 [Hymenobacter sp. M29]|uniref:Uncharacterized protein n=1 Tax=Hymenobacter mellowenesis TaxID=3063995 RepID=A0ABT9AIJ6_9BACT|nr:hypothetical protein [Hymenobacter sp. M29]MDO7848796.1 hypothetical protein [Hymenobacter sp. M29]